MVEVKVLKTITVEGASHEPGEVIKLSEAEAKACVDAGEATFDLADAPAPAPEATPEATPESTPEATPEATPESTPESTPEATPENQG